VVLSPSKEYGLTTAAGVMRFLQLEWHNHERARNAWDIERAEMKAKIAKQEGEVRSAKKLNDQLNKHIRMLEKALLNERARSKAAAAGGDTQTGAEGGKDAKGKLGSRADSKGAVKPTKRTYNLPCHC
jgi:striatin 1/3/4